MPNTIKIPCCAGYQILTCVVNLREARLRARDREIQTFQVGQMAERKKRMQEERQEATTFR